MKPGETQDQQPGTEFPDRGFGSRPNLSDGSNPRPVLNPRQLRNLQSLFMFLVVFPLAFSLFPLEGFRLYSALALFGSLPFLNWFIHRASGSPYHLILGSLCPGCDWAITSRTVRIYGYRIPYHSVLKIPVRCPECEYELVDEEDRTGNVFVDWILSASWYGFLIKVGILAGGAALGWFYFQGQL